MTINFSKVKISGMVQALGQDELAELQATPLDVDFKPVALSPKAIDLASQLIPEAAWMKYGLHTYLSLCANRAFRKLKVDEREIRSGRLTYFFEVVDEEPVLAKIKVD